MGLYNFGHLQGFETARVLEHEVTLSIGFFMCWMSLQINPSKRAPTEGTLNTNGRGDWVTLKKHRRVKR